MVLRISAEAESDDQPAWEKAAEKAFGYRLEGPFRAVLLLSHSKVTADLPYRLKSRNQLRTELRGGRPRPRRPRGARATRGTSAAPGASDTEGG